MAVADTFAADHVNIDNVCTEHIRAVDLEEPQTSTFLKNLSDKYFYDLRNFTKKILSDNENRQILNMGPLQPSGPFPTDINQNNSRMRPIGSIYSNVIIFLQFLSLLQQLKGH